jgi:DNA-directed RNA polymerase specialized sigma24 family protein
MGGATVPLRQAPEPLDDAYRRLRPALVRLAYLLTGSAETAEDVVHDAVVAASRHWPSVDNPDGYLRRAVVNTARSSHRRTGREHDKVARFGALAGPGSGRPAPGSLAPEVDETWAVLRRLPDRQRQALVLRFYEDLPDAEIAELLGCRVATVRSLVFRGLAKVKEELR